MRKDVLIGRQEIAYESRHGPSFLEFIFTHLAERPTVELDVVFDSTEEYSGHPTELPPPHLTVTVVMSANESSSMSAEVDIPNPTMTHRDEPFAGGGARRSAAQVDNKIKQVTEATSLSPFLRTADPLPIESGTPVGPVVGTQTEMSSTLDRAEEAIDTVKTWKGTVDIIKRVMDIVGPIVHVSPCCFFSILR